MSGWMAGLDEVRLSLVLSPRWQDISQAKESMGRYVNYSRDNQSKGWFSAVITTPVHRSQRQEPRGPQRSSPSQRKAQRSQSGRGSLGSWTARRRSWRCSRTRSCWWIPGRESHLASFCETPPSVSTICHFWKDDTNVTWGKICGRDWGLRMMRGMKYIWMKNFPCMLKMRDNDSMANKSGSRFNERKPKIELPKLRVDGATLVWLKG